jgi:Mg2+/citrate symporter
MAAALADSSIERLTSVNWAPQDRWGDTPLQVRVRACARVPAQPSAVYAGVAAISISCAVLCAVCCAVQEAQRAGHSEAAAFLEEVDRQQQQQEQQQQQRRRRQQQQQQ